MHGKRDTGLKVCTGSGMSEKNHRDDGIKGKFGSG